MSVRDGAAGDPETRRTPFATREFALRVASAIVLAGIVLFALFVGGWLFAAVWLAAAVVGACEWLAMSRTEPARALMLVTCLILVVLMVLFEAGARSWVTVGIGALGTLALAGLARGPGGKLNAVSGLLGAIVVALVPTALRDEPAIGVIGPAWMFAIVWSTDVAAYFTGRSLGGPKLMPRVSPKKTWTGALGGLVAGTLAGLGVVLVARGYGWTSLAALPVPVVVMSSAAASIVSQGGDLFESALKRTYGVKDSGQSIPGHGGIMDRLDGFFAVAVLAGLYLVAQKTLLA